MELVFDVVGGEEWGPGLLTSKAFSRAGGIIGRAEGCDWVIPDRSRVLSGRHATVSYRDGGFFLTDTSSNGIQLADTGASLPKGLAQRIENGSEYCLGDVRIRARLLQDPTLFEGDLGRPQPAGSLIPDDAFLDLDPLRGLEYAEPAYAEVDELALLTRPLPATQQHDSARSERDHLQPPTLMQPTAPRAAPAQPVQPAPAPASFWERFGAVLGVDVAGLDEGQREALALRCAQLLTQCIGNLQQSLRTRSELKNELRLALTSVQGAGSNPLKHSVDSQAALQALLRDARPGQLPAERAISLAFRDLQAHQVALLAASRATVRGMLEHLSPERLALQFERDGKPLLATAGGRWRAYRRWHRALQQDSEWSERLFARDFAQAYEEQVRLIATLSTDVQG